MQIQVNSDNHIDSSIRLEEWVKTVVDGTLERYEEDLTRIVVHLSDENGAKPGPNDLRCQMEARPKGHQPISVTHKADTLNLAVEGAAEKLEHALEHLFGKLRSKRAGASQVSNPRGTSSETVDAMLTRDFENREEANLG